MRRWQAWLRLQCWHGLPVYCRTAYAAIYFYLDIGTMSCRTNSCSFFGRRPRLSLFAGEKRMRRSYAARGQLQFSIHVAQQAQGWPAKAAVWHPPSKQCCGSVCHGANLLGWLCGLLPMLLSQHEKVTDWRGHVVPFFDFHTLRRACAGRFFLSWACNQCI